MIYVTSDLHGYPLDSFKRFLERVGFCDDDFLFVLGDVIDRNGDGGVMLLQWMMMQPNVELILGNHEAMLLACNLFFEEITEENIALLDEVQSQAWMDWVFNGAEPTLKALSELRKKDIQMLHDLVDYIREAPLYDTVYAGERDFLLVHSGLNHFEKHKALSAYDPNDLLWHRPAPDERYFEDVLTILGHTPTAFYGSPHRMYRTPTWIDIDTGAGSGYAPMLLRLDDLHPFYIEQQ